MTSFYQKFRIWRLIQQFRNNGENNDAKDKLAKIGESSVPQLITALKTDDWRVSAHAAESLGNFRDIRAVLPLIEALKSDNTLWVRKAAAKALGTLQDSRAILPLIVALKDDDLFVRVQVAKSLAKISPEDIRSLRALQQAIISTRERWSKGETQQHELDSLWRLYKKWTTHLRTKFRKEMEGRANPPLRFRKQIPTGRMNVECTRMKIAGGRIK